MKRETDPAAFGGALFSIQTVRRDDTAVIELTGEFDLAHSPQLEAAILDAEASEMGRIVIDLSGLTFVDSSGLAVLLAADARSRQDSNRLRFVPCEHESVVRGPKADRNRGGVPLMAIQLLPSPVVVCPDCGLSLPRSANQRDPRCPSCLAERKVAITMRAGLAADTELEPRHQRGAASAP